MGWIQLILLLIQIMREFRQWKAEPSDQAFIEAGFVKKEGKIIAWEQNVSFRRLRKNINATIIYYPANGKWIINSKDETKEFDTLDAFERHIRNIRKDQ